MLRWRAKTAYKDTYSSFFETQTSQHTYNKVWAFEAAPSCKQTKNLLYLAEGILFLTLKRQTMPLLAALKPSRFNFSVFGVTLEIHEFYCWCIIISVETSLFYVSKTIYLSINRTNQKNQKMYFIHFLLRKTF